MRNVFTSSLQHNPRPAFHPEESRRRCRHDDGRTTVGTTRRHGRQSVQFYETSDQSPGAVGTVASRRLIVRPRRQESHVRAGHNRRL